MEKKNGILVLIMVLIIISVVLLIPKNKEYKIKEDNITKEEYNTLSMFIVDGEKETPIDKTPDASKYEIDTNKSYCKRGDQELRNILTTINNNFVFKELHTNDKCYLWFNKITNVGDLIIDNSTYYDGTTPNFSQTACDSGCNTTDKGLYKTQDDDGDTYYFRGSVTDNWVKFAGYYWRIIRINGDGTIRLIYSGDESETNVDFPNSNKTNPAYVTNTGTQVTIDNSNIIAFNISPKQNRYVGYMYGSTSGDYSTSHKNDTSSNIKTKLESWYSTNLENKSVGSKKASDYIDTDAGFCGDRTPYDGYGSSATVDYTKGGTTTTTYYGGYFRLAVNKQPDLHCKRKTGNNGSTTTLSEDNDLYTVSGSKKGNKAISKPVGLISADEVSFAGGRTGANNQGYYLYTGQTYWTMSPSDFSGWAWVFYVDTSGKLSDTYAYYSYGVRPVINLKADTKIAFQNPNGENKGTYLSYGQF